jgi:hypothetical protein
MACFTSGIVLPFGVPFEHGTRTYTVFLLHSDRGWDPALRCDL